MDAAAFDRLASGALSDMMDAIESQLADHLDIEYQGGILTIEIPDVGTYVLNKHAPQQEIWLSSPQSGAWHFAHDPARNVWRSTRGEDHPSLYVLLARELSAATGVSFSFLD